MFFLSVLKFLEGRRSLVPGCLLGLACSWILESFLLSERVILVIPFA